MAKLLLWMLAVMSTSISTPFQDTLVQKDNFGPFAPVLDNFLYVEHAQPSYPKAREIFTLHEIKTMLEHEAPTLSPNVVRKIMVMFQCVRHTEHKPILTVIDYSLPSNQKRLWVFDLNQKKLLFYTYVSHGIKSGALITHNFSNQYNSKATSIGVYKTEHAYYGRDGLSLRLEGLEHTFNGNAMGRYIVMHGGWYVEEDFIKKYGRPGRSWGCPAVPIALTQAIINTIKEDAFFVAYYPSDDWFTKSKFLNCNASFLAENAVPLQTTNNMLIDEDDTREDILFIDKNHNNQRDEYEPILAVSAENYQKIFAKSPPLTRMLRRQIEGMEYIALTQAEFNKMSSRSYSVDDHDLSKVYLIVPNIQMVHGGYYETQMKVIGNLQLNNNIPQVLANLKSTNQFIRWIGL